MEKAVVGLSMITNPFFCSSLSKLGLSLVAVVVDSCVVIFPPLVAKQLHLVLRSQRAF